MSVCVSTDFHSNFPRLKWIKTRICLFIGLEKFQAFTKRENFILQIFFYEFNLQSKRQKNVNVLRFVKSMSSASFYKYSMKFYIVFLQMVAINHYCRRLIDLRHETWHFYHEKKVRYCIKFELFWIKYCWQMTKEEDKNSWYGLTAHTCISSANEP